MLDLDVHNLQIQFFTQVIQDIYKSEQNECTPLSFRPDQQFLKIIVLAQWSNISRSPPLQNINN